MLTLEVQPRENGKSPAHLRRDGITPAVFYGPKEDATPISIDSRRLESVWKEAGETTIITLKGVGSDKDTLIRDVSFDPISGRLLHADFYVLEKGKKIEISVPLEFVGEAPAEKLGHILVKTLHEVEIEVSPSELPHSLDVDISKLENVGDHLLASDIKLPKSASLKTDPEEILISVTPFEEYKEQEIPTGAAPASEVSSEETPSEGSGDEGASKE